MRVPIAMIIAAGVAAAVAGCKSLPGAAAPRVLTQAELNATGLTESEQHQAQELYLLKCAKCHGFYDPANYSEVEWNRWMETMALKAKLDSTQKTLLSQYLDAFRAD